MQFDQTMLRHAFDEQSKVFLDLVDACDDLSTSTRLDGWNCAVLVGHVSTAVEGLIRWPGSAEGIEAEWNAVTWWDGAAAASELNDAFSRGYVSKRSHQEIRDIVAEAARRAGEAVAATPADTIVVLPGGVAWARFDQALATRVFELTVHGIDLAQAIDAAVSPSATALSVVATILDERLDGERPAGLADDLSWVMAATGRTESDDRRLPVMW